MKTKIIVILVLVILFLIMLLQNSYEVSLHFLFWKISSIPQIVLLAVTLIAGFVIGFLSAVLAGKNKRKKSLAPKKDSLS